MTPRHTRSMALIGAMLALGITLCAALPAAAQGTPPATPDQHITLESPAAGTQVGSPVVISGSLTRLPADAQLRFTVLASDGRQLGAGSFPIPGDPGQPAFFIASLIFVEPPDGDSITLQLFDQDPLSGAVAAAITLPLVTAPLPQRIVVETPGSGTLVGNPVVLTGRTARLPAAGVLGYAIYDSAGAQVGGGVFPVAGNVFEGGRFSASLSFAYPPFGGPLRIDLYDQDPFTGAFPATATLVARTLALSQQISVETPIFGTQVGSPVVLTGRTALYPTAGVLQYQILDGQGAVLGAGTFAVQGAPGDAARFAASLTFQPPAAPGPLRAFVFEADQSGRVTTSTTVEMRWGAP